MKEKITLGHLAALFTAIVWGTTFISTKVLLVQLTPVTILFLRFMLGFLALAIVGGKLLKLKKRRHEWYFIGAGLCGVTLYFLFENIALTYTFASNVGIIVSVSPFFVAVLNRLLFKSGRLHPLFFAGFAAAMAGILFITFGSGNTGLAVNPLGDGLALLAAVVWAVYSLLTKKIGALGYPSVKATRRIFFWGILFMLPVLYPLGFSVPIDALLTPCVFGNLLYLGLGASALCFASWNFALRTLGAVKTSVYIYLVPVITVAASALILDEPFTLVTAAGALLTLAGLALSQKRS